MSKIARTLTGVSFLALALTYTTWAQAGPNDTPLPFFSNGGPQAVHVYTATAVIKNNGIESVFICTNLGPGSIKIGVEVFDKTGSLGNNIAAGNGEALNVAEGATVTVATATTAVLTEDVVITGLSNLKNGSGRIVASTTNISCAAMLVDQLHVIEDPAQSSDPPPAIVNLPLIRVN